MYWSPWNEPGNPQFWELLVTAIHKEFWVLGGGHCSCQCLCVVTRTRLPAVTELSPTVWKTALTLGFNKTIGYSNALESQSHKSGNDSHSLVMKNSPPHAVWDRGATKQTVNSREEGLSWHFLSFLSEIPSHKTHWTRSWFPLVQWQNSCRCNNELLKSASQTLGGWELRLIGFLPTYCMH